MASNRLLKVFVLPFLSLVLALVLALAWVAWDAGQNITDALSQKVLLELAGRINQATERHLLTSHIALKSVVPDTVETAAGAQRAEFDFTRDLPALRERLWIASGMFPLANQYVYYASADGGFVGVNRIRGDFIELRQVMPGQRERRIYSLKGPDETISLIRSDQYEARSRPWYRSADPRRGETWSPVYIDYTTKEPVLTLAKPVLDGERRLRGIAATDISLAGLSDFLRSLPVSENGVAFIVERSGEMIATSADELPYRMVNEKAERLKVADSKLELVRRAYDEVVKRLYVDKNGRSPLSFQFASEHGVIQAVATQLRDDAGLNWISVVAVPRPDFMGSVMAGVYHNVGVGILVVLAVSMLGALLLYRTVGDIRRLAVAARDVADGAPAHLEDLQREDELGELAHSIGRIEHELHTDRLTQLLNRDSLFAQVKMKMRSATQAHPLRFALLYIDLDRFSMVNDRYGQDAGDIALAEVARRLKHLLREQDLLARYRGDEFLAYLHGADNERSVEAVCEKIQWALDAPIRVNDKAGVHLTCAIGAALYPGDAVDGMSLEELVRQADTRMGRAKGADTLARPRSVVLA